VVDAISAAIGANKTAIRLAPFYSLKGANDANRLETFSAYSESLESRGLAYVHFVEPRHDQAQSGTPFDAHRSSGLDKDTHLHAKEEDTLWPFRRILKKTISIAAGGHSAESAREALLEGTHRDLDVR